MTPNSLCDEVWGDFFPLFVFFCIVWLFTTIINHFHKKYEVVILKGKKIGFRRWKIGGSGGRRLYTLIVGLKAAPTGAGLDPQTSRHGEIWRTQKATSLSKIVIPLNYQLWLHPLGFIYQILFQIAGGWNTKPRGMAEVGWHLYWERGNSTEVGRAWGQGHWEVENAREQRWGWKQHRPGSRSLQTGGPKAWVSHKRRSFWEQMSMKS